jgi:hypothetical protein
MKKAFLDGIHARKKNKTGQCVSFPFKKILEIDYFWIAKLEPTNQITFLFFKSN